MKTRLIIAAVLVLLAGGTAWAIDIQNFQPAIGTQNLVTLYTSSPYAHGQFGFALTGSYAANPFIVSFSDNEELRIAERMISADLQGAVGLFGFMDLGVAGRFDSVAGRDFDVRMGPAFPENDAEAGSGLGDLRIMMKFQLFENRPGSLGVALVPMVSLPTGNPDTYSGAEAFNAGGRLVIDKRFDLVNIVLNGGYIYMADSDGPDEGFNPSGRAEFGAGVTVMVHRYVELLGEIYGRTADYDIEHLNMEVPTEAIAAMKFFAGPVHFTLGGGLGVNSGIGNPAWRAFAGIGLTVPALNRERAATEVFDPNSRTEDRDHDGLSNYEETNVYRTDPLNADTDGDGLSDGDEVNTYHTSPVNPDTDHDGVSDGQEVRLYGTDPVNSDTDNDGLTDGQEVNDLRTNPLNPDTDGDGIPDGRDAAPLEGGSRNTYLDEDGIPQAIVARRPGGVIMLRDQFVLPRPLMFEGPQSALLSADDRDLLDQVASILQEYPQVKIQIEGHVATDIAEAKKLTQDRAEAVMSYLQSRGVDASRMVAVGMGSEVPIASNNTVEGRRRNTRIDIIITAR